MDAGKTTECISNAVCKSDGNTGLQCTCNNGFYDANFNTSGGLCEAGTYYSDVEIVLCNCFVKENKSTQDERRLSQC